VKRKEDVSHGSPEGLKAGTPTTWGGD